MTATDGTWLSESKGGPFRLQLPALYVVRLWFGGKEGEYSTIYMTTGWELSDRSPSIYYEG